MLFMYTKLKRPCTNIIIIDAFNLITVKTSKIKCYKVLYGMKFDVIVVAVMSNGLNNSFKGLSFMWSFEPTERTNTTHRDMSR